MPEPSNNGSDRIQGDESSEFLDGGNGNDTVRAGFGDDIVLGGNGDDSLTGGSVSLFTIPSDDDYIDGGNGNDRLLGVYGDDTLVGGNGDDRLNGEAGANLLTGGNGNDIFQFGFTVPLAPVVFIGQDTITDFGDGDDIINLQGLNRFGRLDLAYEFIGQEAFSGTRPEVRYRWENGNTVIELDTSQFQPVDGIVDGTIVLLGEYTLTADDFLL